MPSATNRTQRTSITAARATSAGTVKGSRAHEDLVALEADLQGPRAGRGFRRVPPRADVVLPAVPGAGHRGPGELAFPDGAASVQARVGHREEPAVHVEEGDRVALDDDDLARAGRAFANARDADRGRHRGAEARDPNEPFGAHAARNLYRAGADG